MTGKDVACNSLDPIFQNWREKLVRWAVDEPDQARAYAGLALGAVGLSLFEAVTKQWLGCPTPLDPPPPPASASTQHLVAAVAHSRRPLG